MKNQGKNAKHVQKITLTNLRLKSTERKSSCYIFGFTVLLVGSRVGMKLKRIDKKDKDKVKSKKLFNYNYLENLQLKRTKNRVAFPIIRSSFNLI